MPTFQHFVEDEHGVVDLFVKNRRTVQLMETSFLSQQVAESWFLQERSPWQDSDMAFLKHQYPLT
jgi:hypothetical protein